jgi:tight adherence protein C
MVGMEILIALLAFVAVVVFSLGIASYLNYRKERWDLSKRMRQLNEGFQAVEVTHALTRIKNYVIGLVGSLGNLIRPKGEKESTHLRDNFIKAGYRRETASIIFSGLKTFLIFFLLGTFLLLKFGIFKKMTPVQMISLSVILVALGFYFPNLWLRWKIERRKEKIIEGFPDALDLMIVCVEAGTSLDGAIHRVGDEMKLSNKVLGDEFKLLSLELKAGKDRREALRNLAERMDLEDVSSFVTLLIQTDKFGTSVAQALRVHSEAMRTKRFQKAEELATKLPVKLLFPLILFIFPSLFITVLGPAVIQIFRTLLPRMGGQ